MIKKVQESDYLAHYYHALPLQKQEEVLEDVPEKPLRHRYTLYHHVKTYNSEQRKGYLLKCLSNICSSWGLAVFKSRTWKHVSKVWFGSTVKWGSQIYNLEVHVVTSDRRIKAITDVLSLAELERLVEIENTMDYFNGRTPNKCLTFMEWKVPDHNSMPRPLKTWFEYSPEQRSIVEKDRFVTSFDPPYKINRQSS